jgi:hypothetical protein
VTVIRCIEADARPPVSELPLEEADGFAIYAMLDAMEGERWLRTMVMRRAGEAPPDKAVLVVEVTMGGVGHDGFPTLLVKEQGRFVSVEIRRDKSRSRMAPGIELPPRCTFEVTLPNQRRMSFDLEASFGARAPGDGKGGPLRSHVLGPGTAARWSVPTVASLLSKARDFVRTKLLALAKRLGLNMGTITLIITFGGSAVMAGIVAYRQHKAAQEAQARAEELEAQGALLEAGRDAALKSEQACLMERQALADKLGLIGEARAAQAEAALSFAHAQNVALEYGGRKMGSKEALALDADVQVTTRKEVEKLMMTLEGTPSEAMLCLGQEAVLGADLPRYLLLWHADPEVVCPNRYANVINNTGIAGRWGLSTRVGAEYGRDERGQPVDTKLFESEAADPRQEDRWSASALASGVRGVQEALLRHPAGGRPTVSPSQAHLWSIALFHAVNQLPSPVGGAQDRPAAKCVLGIIDELVAQASPAAPGEPLLPSIVDVAHEDAKVAAQPQPGCPWQQDTIRDGARAALRAAAWAAILDKPPEAAAEGG